MQDTSKIPPELVQFEAELQDFSEAVLYQPRNNIFIHIIKAKMADLNARLINVGSPYRFRADIGLSHVNIHSYDSTKEGEWPDRVEHQRIDTYRYWD